MSAPLHARYQRLIALYPPGHRAVYADDMITALMAGTSADQRRPSLRTSADLLKGAVQAWALRAGAKARSWQHLSAPPAIALLALLVLAPRSLTAGAAAVHDPSYTPYSGPLAVLVMLPHLIWLPLTAAALLGVRRGAVPIAVGVGIVWPLLNTLVGVSGWAPNFFDSPDRLPWLPVALMAVAGLSGDHARQGLRALERTTGIAAVTGALLTGFALTGLLTLTGTDTPGVQLVTAVVLVAGAGLIALASLTTVARTGPGRAAAALAVVVTVPLCGLYAWHGGGTWSRQLQEATSLALPLTLLICSGFVTRAARRTSPSPTVDARPA